MKRFVVMLPLVLMVGCSSEPTAPVAAASNEAPERRTEAVTMWSGKTELFVEFPALVQAEDSRLAIHLTRLDSFRPVAAGRAEVRLTYAEGGASESFSADAPSRPGIFGVTVKPSRSGEATVEILLKTSDLADSHRLERVPVYATLAAAPTEEEPATEETIAFLKEQQWAMDFGTGVAQTGTMRESMVVPAEVSARSGGQADVTAPVAGRLAGENLPVLGTRVTQGQILASVIPPTSVPNDRAALDLAKAEAEAALEYARRDRTRASRLVEVGAAPRKRLEEAATAESIAEARLRAADERIKQFESSRTAQGTAGALAIRAPIGGTVVEMSASPGANLRGGEVLFHIVDTDRVYVSAIVPEAEYPKIRSLSGAEIEIPGSTRPRPAGRLISVGKVVDAASRTFPVVYEFGNADGSIAINQTVTVRLFLSGSRRGVMVPEEALVDDGGRLVVFIQREGEAFVRRPVEVGYRQTGLAEITSGLEVGDRIVTKGAYLIRLAALSTQIPAHGHVH